jgi:limonene-1,2-epoxide hydrolase
LELIEIVREFFRQCAEGKEGLHRALREYFTDETVWENVGIVTTTGIEEAIEVMNRFEEAAGVVTFEAEILAIATDGSKVLTERIDRLVDENGADAMAATPVMGILEFEGEKIVAWREYTDSRAFAQAVNL